MTDNSAMYAGLAEANSASCALLHRDIHKLQSQVIMCIEFEQYILYAK